MSREEQIANAIYEYVGNIEFEVEDYHIFNMQTYCVIKDNKHIITTIVDYVKNQKRYRKIFENVLEKEVS